MNNTPNQVENLSIQDIIKGLTEKAKNNSFAASLLANYKQWGRFTPKQMPHAQNLAREALFPASVSLRVGEKLGADFKQLIEKFATAKNNGLKRPALTFLGDTNFGFGKFKIYPAKADGVNAGFLYVKGEGPFGTYYGKINSNGEFFRSKDCSDRVMEFLKSLSNDPVKFCAQRGRETGICCFCARELSDGRSLRAGFGKICSDKYNLPWGE